MKKIGENCWEYRLFVSHVGADQALALALVKVLQTHTVAVADGTVRIVPVYMEKVADNLDQCYGNFMEWSGSRVLQSDGVLAIVSHNACAQDADGDTVKVMDNEISLARGNKKDIVLLLQVGSRFTAGRSILLQNMSYVSYVDQPTDKNLQELLADIDTHVRHRVAGTPLLEYGGKVAVELETESIPDTAEFVGREQDIADIQNAFENEHKHVVCIYGQGGMGKTTLAKMYAAAHPQTPVTICYCDADTSLMDAIIRLPVRNDLDDFRELPREEKYKRRCSQLHGLVGRYIIILDNFNADFGTKENKEVLSALSCMPTCDFIISSRNTATDGKKRTDIGWLPIKPLHKDELVQLFYDNSGCTQSPQNDSAIDKLLTTTACHTMTIMLAAKAVAVPENGLTPQMVAERLLADSIETRLEDTARHDGFDNYASIRSHLRTLFALSNLQPVHHRLLGALSLVPRHGLAVQDLKDCHCFDTAASRQLRLLGYISTTQDQPPRLYTHPLLQELCFDDYVVSHAAEYSKLLRIIVYDYVKTSEELTATQQDMAVDYGSLLIKRLTALQKHGIDDKKLQGDLCASLGYVYYYQGKHAEAETMYRQSIAIREALVQETGTIEARRVLAGRYNNLGFLYYKQGKQAKAEAMYLQAITLRAALVQETGTIEARSDLAESYNNLGLLYYAQGKQADAETIYRQAIALIEALVQETGTAEARRTLAQSYNDLGALYDDQGKQTEAETMYRQAIALREAMVQETGTVAARRDLAQSYSCLGGHYDDQGKEADAETMYRQSIAIREALVQETGTVEARSDLAASYNNLGSLYYFQGKQADAAAVFRQSMVQFETLVQETGTAKARGDLACTYNNLALLYCAQGKQVDAEAMYRQAIELRAALVQETGTVDARSGLAGSYKNLGRLYWEQGKQANAEEMLRQSIAQFELLAQETDTVRARSDLARSYNSLGNLYWDHGKQAEAESMYRQSIAICEALVQETGTVVARRELAQIYGNLGILYSDQGKEAEAEAIHRQSIAIYEALAQETGTISERLDLTRSYNNVGVFYMELGNYAEAECLYRQALSIGEGLVQETSIAVARRYLANCYNNLGVLYEDQGKQAEAEKLYLQAIAIREALVQETGTVVARSDLAGSYNNLGNLYSTQGKHVEAENMYRQAIALYEALVRETGAVKANNRLVGCYMSMANCCKNQGKHSEYLEWCNKAQEIKGGN